MQKSLNMAMLHVIQVFQKVRENMQTDFPRFSGTIKKFIFFCNLFQRNNSIIMLRNNLIIFCFRT